LDIKKRMGSFNEITIRVGRNTYPFCLWTIVHTDDGVIEHRNRNYLTTKQFINNEKEFNLYRTKARTTSLCCLRDDSLRAFIAQRTRRKMD
jgi:hypothetical protein